MKVGLKAVSVMAALGILLSLVAFVRGLRLDSPQAAFRPTAPVELPALDSEAAAARLARALTYRTLSRPAPEVVDTAAFLALHDFLEASYPWVHAELVRERVNGLSLLYTWEGTEPGLEPVVLMGHQDVVPVAPGTEAQWIHDPWGGQVEGGYVWGRGAVDDKSSVLGILEAVESLVAEGYRPRRTFYLAFGHDEEVGGSAGARALADTVVRRTPALALVVDEGGAVVEGAIPGVSAPTALVGIAEKGFLSLRLSTQGRGGHSSVPPPSTSVGILAAAIRRLEENPFPMELDGPTRTMLEAVAPDASPAFRTILGNMWLFGPLVRRILGSEPKGAATLRTTTAVTMFDAGVKDNVLPITAEAVVNFRIRPGETVESTMERVQEVVDDPRVAVELAYPGAAQEPSPVSDPEGPAFRVVARSIHEATGHADLLVVPYLVVGATDAKYYSGRSRDVFRFLPVHLGDAGLTAIHGTNERIAVDDFTRAIYFFRRLILNAETLGLR